jgi:hypothetical protein
MTVFALCSLLMAGDVSAWTFESESFSMQPLGDAPSDQAMFSTGVDFFLGQSKRRRGNSSGGGRVWANLYYGDTTLKPKEGGKINPAFYGFQLGLDIPKSRGEHSTFFFNLNQSKTKFAGVTSNIDNYLFGYGKFIYFGMCHFAFSGSLAYDKYQVEVPAFSWTGVGDGLQTNFFGEFGLDFILGQWGIKPFYALQYDFLYHGNIGERSSVLLPDSNDHGLQQLFGLRLNWKATTLLELQSRAVWVHEMLDHPPSFYRGRFSPVHGVHTPVLTFYEGNTGRDWAWLGIGAKLEIINLYFFGDYDLLLNGRHITHLGSLGLCLNW